MKLNRKWLLIIALLVSLSMATASTLAFLTDRDSDANVFTVGNVQIDLTEDFEQGAELIPGIDVEKIPTITNIGKSDAWVWMTIAVPDFFDNVGSANENVVHWNWMGGTVSDTLGTAPAITQDKLDGYKANGWIDESITLEDIRSGDYWIGGDSAASYIGQETIDGVTYNMYVYKYNTPLKPGEETVAGPLVKVYMDDHVDIDPEGNVCLIRNGVSEKTKWNINTMGNPVIHVGAYGIQAEGFDTVDLAFAAYNEQWGDNGNEWADPPEIGDKEPVIDGRAEYNGTVYNSIHDAVAAAGSAGGTVKLLGSYTLDKPVEFPANLTIDGSGHTYTRADGFTGTMFSVATGATLTVDNLTLDGDGAAATGNLIATAGSGSIVLNEGTVLTNNNGAHAVSLATRGGGTLTLNGAEITNNSSDSGAIWGGGHIIVNEGSKINNNSSTGSAGAIRMVGKCNLTMNGGEICNNKAAGDGGAIWGYGISGNTSVYDLKGGKISGNTAAGTGGAIYTGNYSTVNMSGDFEMCNNTAADSGAMRITNYTILNMTGGKISGNVSTNNADNNGFYGWCPRMTLSGGTLADNISVAGGHTPTIGACKITGIVHFDIGTTHNTVNLAENFGSFRFTVAEGGNFSAFNLKPAAGYTYKSGDEAKLTCLNDGYTTYWDATAGTFKLKAD